MATFRAVPLANALQHSPRQPARSMALSCPAVRHRRRVLCASAQEPSPSSTVQPDTPGSSPAPSQPACPFDTNYWHYSRFHHWYQQRAFLVPAGLSFIILANLLETPGLKTTLVASIPVALMWYLALYLVPKNFARYAQEWASTEESKRTN